MQRAAPELSCVPLAERAFVRTSDTLVSLSLSLSFGSSFSLSVSLALSLHFSLARSPCVLYVRTPVGGRILPVASRCSPGWPLQAATGKEKQKYKVLSEVCRMSFFLLSSFFSLSFIFSFLPLRVFPLAGNILRAV